MAVNDLQEASSCALTSPLLPLQCFPAARFDLLQVHCSCQLGDPASTDIHRAFSTSTSFAVTSEVFVLICSSNRLLSPCANLTYVDLIFAPYHTQHLQNARETQKSLPCAESWSPSPSAPCTPCRSLRIYSDKLPLPIRLNHHNIRYLSALAATRAARGEAHHTSHRSLCSFVSCLVCAPCSRTRTTDPRHLRTLKCQAHPNHLGSRSSRR